MDGPGCAGFGLHLTNAQCLTENILAPLGGKLNLHIFGGSINQTHFKEETEEIFHDAMVHPAVDRDKVVDVYHNSYCVVNVSRQKYYKAGWATSRWYEAVNGGAILLLPDSYRYISDFFSEEFIVPAEFGAIIERVKWVKSLSYEKRCELNDKQRKQVLPFFSTISSFKTIFLKEDCVDGT